MTVPRPPRLAVLLAAALLTFGPARAQQSPPDAPAPTLQLVVPPAAAPGQGTEGVAAESAGEIARTLENPLGDVTRIPVQNNTNFNVGPHKGALDVLNVEPIIPIHLNPDWNLITRTILPLVWSPSLQPAQSVPFGLAPTTFSAFLSPRQAVNGWVWGVGPIIELPTITNASLGSNVWGLGPAVVVVKSSGPIVAGALINNVFSLGGTTGHGAGAGLLEAALAGTRSPQGRHPALSLQVGGCGTACPVLGTSYSLLTINPFFNYNFRDGWFVGSVPIITANWDAHGEQWTLPVGAMAGRVIKLGGKLPINLLIGAYYNVLRPQFGATWQLRTQVAVVF